MILLIDHYDSFVHNLARYFQQLGQRTCVLRSDAITAETVDQLQPEAIVFSPGPGSPREAGNSMALVCQYYHRVPMLGVCLGHQIIAAALGAAVVQTKTPMHGRSSLVQHGGARLFAGLPSPLTVGRYHSLIVDEVSLSDELIVTARTPDATVMALEHVSRPVFGVQFHPESVLSEGGYRLLANFLRLAECCTQPRAELPTALQTATPPPPGPRPAVPIPY